MHTWTYGYLWIRNHEKDELLFDFDERMHWNIMITIVTIESYKLTYI